MTEKIVFVYGWDIFCWCATWRIHRIVGASALYALGHWLFIAALSSRQYLYQRELVVPMRWVKVFLLSWSVIRIWKATRSQFDRLFHVQNSTLFDDMHRKPIDCERWNETAISCRTQLFNGFWIIINRRINCPTIACTCMSTELLFFTIRTVVYSVTIREKYCTFGTTIALWKNLSVTRRFDPQTLKTLRSTASTTGLVSESGQSKHSVQMWQEFICIIKYSWISNIVCIHCRESCTYM